MTNKVLYKATNYTSVLLLRTRTSHQVNHPSTRRQTADLLYHLLFCLQYLNSSLAVWQDTTQFSSIKLDIFKDLHLQNATVLRCFFWVVLIINYILFHPINTTILILLYDLLKSTLDHHGLHSTLYTLPELDEETAMIFLQVVKYGDVVQCQHC